MIYFSPNFKANMLRSYSMWSIYLGGLTLLIPSLMLYFGIETNPVHIGWAAFVFLVVGIVGKPIDQNRSGRLVKSMFIGSFAFGMLMFALSIGQGIYDDLTLPEPPDIEQVDEKAAFLPKSTEELVIKIMSKKPAPVVVPLNKAGPVSDGEFLKIAIPHTAQWEGKRNKAYLDRIASPPVWTVCYGETRGVKQGDYYTDAQCDRMLSVGLLHFRKNFHKYLTSETISTRLPATRDASFTGFAWNVGIHGAGKSTAARRLNAGQIPGACEAMTWWNKAGGRVIRGLTNRRASEYHLCMIGLTS